MDRLKNKKIVITGGSDGIGYEFARVFVEEGAEVIIIGRDKNKLDKKLEILNSKGSRAKAIAFDLVKFSKMPDLASSIRKIFPEIDVLVNNVGGPRFKPFMQMSIEDLDYNIDINFKSMFLTTQYLLPLIKNEGGSIINISSYHGSRCIPGPPTNAYGAMKAAVNALTKNLAYELGKMGIRVNAISPGNIMTSPFKAHLDSLPEEGKSKMKELIGMNYPLNRIGNTNDLCGAGVYLASDESSWVTGSILHIDGGVTTN